MQHTLAAVRRFELGILVNELMESINSFTLCVLVFYLCILEKLVCVFESRNFIYTALKKLIEHFLVFSVYSIKAVKPLGYVAS